MSVVNSATKYLGTSYVWGGSTPSGFDCSGLTQYAFKENGITIPRTAQEQYAYTTNSRITNESDLKAGDLVFFKGYTNSATNPGHVGIYVGNGQFIESPKTGDVVKISNLSDRNDFVGGGRVEGSESESLTTMVTTVATAEAEKQETLNFIGKIISFVILLGLAVVCVIFFTKAFDISVSPTDMIKDAIKETLKEE